MRNLFTTLAAGGLALGLLTAAPASAEGVDALHARMQDAGTPSRYAQVVNPLSGAVTGGGYGRGGYGGYGRGGYGYGRGGYDGGRRFGGRGYYGRRSFGPRYGYGYRRW